MGQKSETMLRGCAVSGGRRVLGVLSWSLYLCSPVEYLIAGGTYKCWVLDTGWWENVIASPGGGMLWEAFVGVVEVYSAVGKSDSGAFMRSGCTSNVVNHQNMSSNLLFLSFKNQSYVVVDLSS